jgi:uncharacterized protein Yka (UPF0111/DUF47 family)
VPFSLTPKDSSFYPLFTASAENLVAATDVLSEFIHDHARRPELAGRLRDLEHAADQTTHAIFKQLNTSFVTPFDREDIYNLASDLTTSWTTSRPPPTSSSSPGWAPCRPR